MQKDRDLSFDAFRGLAIIAVVAIHADYLPLSSGAFLVDSWNFLFLAGYCHLLNFCVPAFLFISGYWLSTRPTESLESYKNFLAKRLMRILVPYFFWSFILLGYAVIKTGEVDIYEIIYKLMAGQACYPYYPYYFVVMIAQLYVITPLLLYINRRRYGPVVILVLNIITLLLLYLSRLLKVIGHLPATQPFYSWIIFYQVGLLAGGGDNKKLINKIRPFILPAILVTLLISVLEGMIILSKYNDVFYSVSMLRYSSFLYAMSVIFGFLLLRERPRHWPKFLVRIGNYSFGIFFIHMIVLNNVFGITRKADLLYSFQPLYQFVVVFITVSICVGLIGIARKLLPESFCRKILGF